MFLGLQAVFSPAPRDGWTEFMPMDKGDQVWAKAVLLRKNYGVGNAVAMLAGFNPRRLKSLENLGSARKGSASGSLPR